MKKIVIFVVFLILCIFSFEKSAYAIYDPLSLNNNKIGVHILFPDELNDATRLVNSSGGDWGYVTIPIQAYDKNLEKWQKFMDECKKLHIIPIIRLATNGDYFNTKVWEKPKMESVLDFANFLNSLEWPTKNRYVVIFNEVNRSDEWGGSSNPKEYAEILSYASTVFKSKNPDFFIISSGMDNASENVENESYNQFTFFKLMDQAVPGVFNQIDGFASHSYPNPGFCQPPSIQTEKSITSFNFEIDFIKSLSSKNLPVFITETGWTQDRFTDNQIGKFYETAFSDIWSDKNVVAVTPFLLKAGTDPFLQFSLITIENKDSEKFKAIFNIKKIKGIPQITQSSVLGEEAINEKDLPAVFFKKQEEKSNKFDKKNVAIAAFKWLLKID